MSRCLANLENPYIALGLAIIEQAKMDYKCDRRNCDYRSAWRIKRWCYGQWFDDLCDGLALNTVQTRNAVIGL